METRPITYPGRAVAAWTPQRVFFSGELEARGPADPLKRFVREMCLHAGEVLNGHAPGPYGNEDARVYARVMLIPGELLKDPGPVAMLGADRTALELSVPVDELQLELTHDLLKTCCFQHVR